MHDESVAADPLDLMEGGGLLDPYPLFAALRSVNPVCRMGLDQLGALAAAASDFGLDRVLGERDYAYVCVGWEETGLI
ncbi:MAG: hypothetical protein LC792_13340, partial [Actinobacteria bacterium]|nr:hypothetical protein [Actinomycetota bacterium]